MRTALIAIIASLSTLGLIGCNPETGTVQAGGSSTNPPPVEQPSEGGGGFFAKSTFKPRKATIDDLEALVYFDYSLSSKRMRPGASADLKEFLDLYPEALNTRTFAFHQDVREMEPVVASKLNLRKVTNSFISAKDEQKGTHLAAVYSNITLQCTREPGKQFVAILLTDGGFEDQPIEELKRLATVRNLAGLYFLGIETGRMKDGTISNKLSILRNTFDRLDIKPHFVTVGNASALEEAKDSLQQTVRAAGSN